MVLRVVKAGHVHEPGSIAAALRAVRRQHDLLDIIERLEAVHGKTRAGDHEAPRLALRERAHRARRVGTGPATAVLEG